MTDEILQINEHQGKYSLTFYVEMSQVDDVIEDAEHDPNGHFWETLADYVVESREIPGDFEFDSEADMMAIHGAKKDLETLRDEFLPYITSPRKMRGLLVEIDEEGLDLDE